MVTAACRAQPGTMTTFGLHLTSYPDPDAGGSIAAYTQEVASAAENSGVFGKGPLPPSRDEQQPQRPATPGGRQPAPGQAAGPVTPPDAGQAAPRRASLSRPAAGCRRTRPARRHPHVTRCPAPAQSGQ